ncbi:MAG: hypothetical protein N2Z60_03340 [Elusimicrobiales bacterium]|nr:hypothetical protein [Elusimicrobiales bacterium]
MTISENQFRNIFKKVVFENRLNFESYLKIYDIVFDKSVENIGISIGDKPILKVNLDYVNEFFKTEKDVEWLISHELLHILFRDYLKKPKDENERFINNISMDALINSYLYWLLGKDYCNGVNKLYENEEEIFQILRPYDKKNNKVSNNALKKIWSSLYKGKIGFSDIKSYLLSIYKENQNNSNDKFIGTHSSDNASLESKTQANESLASDFSNSQRNSDNCDNQNSRDKQNQNKESKDCQNITRNKISDLKDYRNIINELEKKIKETISQSKNSKISNANSKNSLKSQALKSDKTEDDEMDIVFKDIEKDYIKIWRKAIYTVLKMFSKSEKSKRKSNPGEFEFFMPILSKRDGRSFVKYLWSPFFPFSKWIGEKNNFDIKTALYFDVSPSMSGELDFLAKALQSFKDVFKTDLWAFSTQVHKAEMKKGKFKFKKTYGTRIEAVFKHIIDKNYRKAVVVTDGFIEENLHELVLKLKKKASVGFIISKDGDERAVKDYGFYYKKLKW